MHSKRQAAIFSKIYCNIESYTCPFITDIYQIKNKDIPFSRIRLVLWTEGSILVLRNKIRLNVFVWSNQVKRKLNLFDRGILLFEFHYF